MKKANGVPPCDHCRKPSAIELEYSAQNLCRKCFTRVFERRVWKANQQFKLLNRKDAIVVGVSGGKDSSALLHILAKMAKQIGFKVIPVLIDEGIHRYRNKAVKKAEEMCKKLGLRLKVFSYKKLFGKTMDEVIELRNKGKISGKACSFCGVFRRKALNQAAVELEGTKIAVGHNADDIAQTFLMNLLRAEPQRNARFGIIDEPQEGFVPRIKPLVFNTEKETAEYCMINNLPFYLGECPYSSEAFRGEVKNFLNETEGKYPGIKFNLLHSFLETKEFYENGGKKEAKSAKCGECGSPSSNALCKACGLKQMLKKL
ncbi:MAG: TIGR00269 family protein [Candidatus Micrarchaeota archaeon]